MTTRCSQGTAAARTAFWLCAFGLALLLSGCGGNRSVVLDGSVDDDGAVQDGEDAGVRPGCERVDRTCDNVDDDCDGETDEDYIPDDTCGIGYCQESNSPSVCQDGHEVVCRQGGSLSAADRTCDGGDDNCNGFVDEDWTTTVTCGLGQCSRSTECVDGQEVCEPGEPSEEICDDEDNDCDGDYDEDQVCGVCVDVVSGTVIQVGSWGECGEYADDCAEVGMRYRTRVVCRAEEPIQEQEPESCRRETERTPCGGERVCVNGQCALWGPCPEENDVGEDQIPLRLARSDKRSASICMADDDQDRYRLTLPGFSELDLTLELDRNTQDRVGMRLFPTVRFEDPPLQGGADGVPTLHLSNDNSTEQPYYLQILNLDRTQDVGYQLDVRYTQMEGRVGCPDADDNVEDLIPIRVEAAGDFQGAICLADNSDDRYRVTVPAGGRVHVEVETDAAATDQIRLWLYDNAGYSEPPLHGGAEGATQLAAENPGDEFVWLYLLVQNVTRDQDISYNLRFSY